MRPAENSLEETTAARMTANAEEHFRLYQAERAANVDRAMAWLLLAEWIAAIIAALWISPRTWNGAESSVHPHVWLAVFGGLAAVALPVGMVWCYPGSTVTRHVVAVAQMLMSAIFIDISGGRVETHFHIFGSLAFLAFYRDWKILLTASVVTTMDHIFRGIWLPETVYGVVTVSPWRWVEHAWWVTFEDAVLVISCNRSIREMRTIAMREAELWYGAHHDALTGLSNRRMLSSRFQSRFGKDGAQRQAGAVIFIDLDRFKEVNDTLGHQVGDKLLIEVSRRFGDVLQDSDLVVRLGGDEFVVVVERLSRPGEAREVGNQILKTFSEPFLIDGHMLFLSASIGISLYPENGSTLDELLDQADIAMYDAKSEGRNRVAFYSSSRRDGARERNEIERSLSQALVRGEMSVSYQPLIGATGKVHSFEALMRWRHGKSGNISPAEFIPIAESTGLIASLGEWVLREACRECAGWQRHGDTKIGVAVNVSAVQLEQPGFSRLVESILEEWRLPPQMLTLEVTETALLKNLDRASEHLSRLRGKGIAIALDDFGTGYSSLSYLQELPADKLKLDRGFVHREVSNGSTVLQSVILMAHRLGLLVVAEGVETKEQKELLSALGCDELQGHYFSKPLPADSVAAFLYSEVELPGDGQHEGSLMALAGLTLDG
jgi:diguanylate cyclase (GGDEF)-like protein